MENTNQETPRQPDLTIVDLVNLKSVVDIAVQRGAFKANELSSVGSVYDKLDKFLSSVSAAQTPKTPADDVNPQ